MKAMLLTVFGILVATHAQAEPPQLRLEQALRTNIAAVRESSGFSYPVSFSVFGLTENGNGIRANSVSTVMAVGNPARYFKVATLIHGSTSPYVAGNFDTKITPIALENSASLSVRLAEIVRRIPEFLNTPAPDKAKTAIVATSDWFDLNFERGFSHSSANIPLMDSTVLNAARSQNSRDAIAILSIRPALFCENLPSPVWVVNLRTGKLLLRKITLPCEGPTPGPGSVSSGG